MNRVKKTIIFAAWDNIKKNARARDNARQDYQ